MGMSYDDCLREKALDDLHDEAVMDRAKKEQCIYLFVEGESEKIAFPLLLRNLIDFEYLGIVLAVYNGNGNLYTALKLLSQTLSWDRPIIATYDNDPDGIHALRKYKNSDFATNRVILFEIPQEPIVRFEDGHFGGSFEESFSQDNFIEACFNIDIVPEHIALQKKAFKSQFDAEKPWLEQVSKFCANKGDFEWKVRKPRLAEKLALSCSTIPNTYVKLANVIKKTRDQYPVRHPSDVDLPKIIGLTYFPDKENDKKLDK